MKKLIGLLLAAPALLVGAVLTAPAAEATHNCVTKQEYRKVHRGMDKNRVARFFDTSGKQSSAYVIGGVHYQTREYNPCGDGGWGWVEIDYKNGKVTGKYAYWG